MPSEDTNLKYLAEIEARKLAQRGLKEGQNFLQGILSSLEDTFIVVFDKEGLINFVWGPTSLEERYGIKFQEYMGKGTTDFLRSVPNEEKLKIINDVFNTLTPVRMEFSMTMPNGMIWVDISVSPLVDNEEGILAVIVAARDITKRKEVEQELKDSEEKFRLIAEQSIVGLIILKDSKFLFVNAKLCEMTGYSEKELSNWDIQKFLHRIHPDDLGSIITAMKNRAEDKKITSSFELRFKQKSGKYIWLQQNTNPIQLKGEMAVLSVLIDITANKDAEKKLVYHNMLLENMSEAVMSTDMDFKILSWNKTAEKMYGWEEKEVIGKNMVQIIKPHFNTPQEEVLSELTDKGYWKGELIHYKKDGTPIDVLNSIAIFKNKNGDSAGFVSINLDITKQKQHEILQRIQRNLATTLNNVSNLHEGLSLCLEVAIKCSRMDCGGIYLFDKISGSLDLISHKGLPDSFLKNASHYEPDSTNAITISKGEKIYTFYQKLGLVHKDLDPKEQLLAVAVIPIKHQNKVIGCLNIASHIHEEVPYFSRVALEIISGQIGTAIIAMQIQESLSEI